MRPPKDYAEERDEWVDPSDIDFNFWPLVGMIIVTAAGTTTVLIVWKLFF